MPDSSGLTSVCWAAVGGDERALEGLDVVERDAWLGGPLPVDGLAVGATATALLAAAELAEARGARRPAVGLSGQHVALSFRSERRALIRGAPAGVGFAPLSRLVRCAHGGWARTHANYRHHAAALGRALGIDVAQPDAVTALEAAAASLVPRALEDAVFAAGGCAVALRSRWAQDPAGQAAADAPVVAWKDSIATR
ncbi:MAG: L-carnitine dehydratase/bile acid-inducible protein [Solirubrobacterales bacterium]|nr:L-carnitine dehydratase/bile acid-inducible protein [Solirubrobacterales bacterium]